MPFITADQIELDKLNPAMKGVTVRVSPLFNIYDGAQTGFALNVKMPNDKRFSKNKFAPFCFETESEAKKAVDIINTWSQS